MHIKYFLNAGDLYLVPQKVTERLDIYFSRNRRLKLSYFNDFDGRECTIYVYFRFYFVHIFFKNGPTIHFWDQNDRNYKTFPASHR